MRELLLGIGVFGIGAFITTAWLRQPDGHTVRRLATGVAALVVGIAVAALSFRASCSVCGQVLRTFTFRAPVSIMPAIEQALTTGDASGARRLLQQTKANRQAGGEQAAPGVLSCALSYCDGCRGMVAFTITGGREARRGTQVVSGDRARAMVPVVETFVGRPAEEQV